ncbi:hypothetical protein Tco_1031905 [Tanacetum coccineum]|uniref:Tf2-1-like SH3-like domain-containing protein n=1 Tax=Tanacetum coccineum TaxID=301880 RepID=A0ABQ5GC15_9ASTR
MKKCLADANLHVPLNEIKVNKTLCFSEELVEIMDQEIKKLKHRKIALVKVRWNSKRGPKFTWEHEDQMRINRDLIRRATCGYPWPELEGKGFGIQQDEVKSSLIPLCHEKVVRIPLEGDETLWVHGKRTQGVVKILMNTKEWNSGDDQVRLRWMIYLVVLADATERVRDAIGFEYCLASSRGWTKSLVLWAEIGESSLIGPELVLETTDKVVLIKEKLKAVRDRQKSYADKRRKLLEFEVGDRVLLKLSPWKGVMRFGKKGKLAPRYVGPFEILERIGLVAYRLRLPEELSSVHDTFHVSNLKKCLADANLHVPLDKIKVDKTLRFAEEHVEIMDREIKNLKRKKIALVKVR